MAREVGMKVTLLDARSSLATEDRFPEVDRIIRAWPEEALSRMNLGEHTSVVVLTHDPKFEFRHWPGLWAQRPAISGPWAADPPMSKGRTS
jgi:xanthine/CO dehydrogenase XdhC/CoxF family maturation factor